MRTSSMWWIAPILSIFLTVVIPSLAYSDGSRLPSLEGQKSPYYENWEEVDYLELSRFIQAFSRDSNEIELERRIPGLQRILKGKIQEVSAFVAFRRSLSRDGIRFVNDGIVASLNRGSRADGIAYSVEGEHLVIHGILESKAGQARFNESQLMRMISKWKLDGLILSERSFGPANIFFGNTKKGLLDIQKSNDLGELLTICAISFPPGFTGTRMPPPFSNEALEAEALRIITSSSSSDSTVSIIGRLKASRIELLRSNLSLIEKFLLSELRWPRCSEMNTQECILNKLVLKLGGRAPVLSMLSSEVQHLPEVVAAANPTDYIEQMKALGENMSELQRAELRNARLKVEPLGYLNDLLRNGHGNSVLLDSRIASIVERIGGWTEVYELLDSDVKLRPEVMAVGDPFAFLERFGTESGHHENLSRLIRTIRLNFQPVPYAEDWILQHRRFPRQLAGSEEERDLHFRIHSRSFPAQEYEHLFALARKLSEATTCSDQLVSDTDRNHEDPRSN